MDYTLLFVCLVLRQDLIWNSAQEIKVQHRFLPFEVERDAGFPASSVAINK